MQISEYELFFGFPINEKFKARLQEVNPYFLSLFIREGDDYLQQVTFNHEQFLGRKIGQASQLSKLESLQVNIYSILKKLVPDFSVEEIPLVLFSLPRVNKSTRDA